jgi:hypothetical protein
LLIVLKIVAPEAGFLPEGSDKLETMTGKDKPLACQIGLFSSKSEEEGALPPFWTGFYAVAAPLSHNEPMCMRNDFVSGSFRGGSVSGSLLFIGANWAVFGTRKNI